MQGHNIVVVGASAGGVEALTRLLAQLPATFNAAVLVVLHIGARQSRLTQILGRASKLPVSRARDGEKIVAGHVYVAPPDLHMLTDDGRIRLVRGPKENFSRPAIDPLFRSAAICFGPRVVAVMLTGYLNDGSAGLIAVKDRGGIAIVQDPAEAFAAAMPRAAIAATPIDHVCSIESMGALLVDYDPPEMQLPAVPEEMEIEHRMTVMEAFLSGEQVLARIGTPSPLTCPDCYGTLYQLNDTRLLRYRCRQGHAVSANALLERMVFERENALWSVVRAFTEEAWLVGRLDEGGPKRAKKMLEHAEALRNML